MVFSPRSDFGAQPNLLALLKAGKLAAGTPIIDMSASNPTALGLLHDPEALASAFSAPSNIYYEPEPRGLACARSAVAEATGSDPAGLYLCASTSEAYGWLFKLLCEPGEAVLVPRPGYPLFDHLAGLEGLRAPRACASGGCPCHPPRLPVRRNLPRLRQLSCATWLPERGAETIRPKR